MKRISEIKREIKKFYKKNDIDHILTSLLSIPLKEIYKDEIIIDEKKEKEIISAFKKIKNGFPVPYITKNVSFYDLEIYVEEGVFIPRPETETLLIEVIEFLKKERFYPERILDLGTGSGCIALFLKKFFPNSEVFGIDINKKACKIALRNSKINNLKINIICADLFSSFKTKFDLIVSNPPYIKEDEFKKLPKEVKKEPFEAIFAGKDGLLFYKKIFDEGKKFLKEFGFLAIEIHPFLEEEIKKISKFKMVKEIYDLNGLKRGFIFQNL